MHRIEAIFTFFLDRIVDRCRPSNESLCHKRKQQFLDKKGPKNVKIFDENKEFEKKNPHINYRHTNREVTVLNEPAIRGYRVDGPW